ncbi:MAG: hypothetical protein AABW64_02565 [Nanoarchaeota archaeon]
MMIISNSSPLILLAKINKIELLKKMYFTVNIPPGVYQEVVVRGKEEKYSDAYLIERCIDDFIVIKKLYEEGREKARKLNKMVGKGESEAIALALQEKADMLLIDNLEPRKVAESNNVKCRSTPGILLEALKKEKISYEEYSDAIKELSSFAWLSGDIVAFFLEKGHQLKEGKKNENK